MTTDTSQTTPLCARSEIGEGGKEIRTDGPAGPNWLMLFNRDGKLTAWRNACPHQGRALNWAPDQFLFDPDGRLVCCHHGASFDLADGRCVGGPCLGARLTPVAVTVRDGWIYLDENL